MHTEAHLFSVPNDCLWYDKLWGPSQRVVTLFSTLLVITPGIGQVAAGLVGPHHHPPPGLAARQLRRQAVQGRQEVTFAKSNNLLVLKLSGQASLGRRELAEGGHR